MAGMPATGPRPVPLKSIKFFIDRVDSSCDSHMALLTLQLLQWPCLGGRDRVPGPDPIPVTVAASCWTLRLLQYGIYIPSASPDDPHSAAPSGDAAVQGPVSARTRQHSQAAAEGSVEVPGRPAPRRTRSSSVGPRPGSAADPNAAASEMARGMRGDSGEAPSAPPAPAVGVRPIAIGSILRRLAARLLLARDRSEVEAALGKAQYGFTPSGRESIMVQINTLLDLHPDWVVAGLDIKNAFNTVSRLALLEECRTRLPQLFPLARACYADASTLFYRDDDGPHNIDSASGSQQGDPFGGVLFALAYRTVLDRLHAAFPDLHVFCFWDDTTLVGPADLVARAISWLNSEEGAIRVNLTFNDDKLQAWSPRAPSDAGLAHLASAGVGTHQLAPPEGGLSLLGVFVGSFDHIATGLSEKLAKRTLVLGSDAWHALRPQAQLLCLVHSISRRALDAARFASPAHLQRGRADRNFDYAILAAVALALDLGPVSELSTELKQRLRLQLKMGGIGIRALRDALHPAFVGGTLDGRSIALDRLSKVPGGRNGELHATLLAMIDPELGGAMSLAAMNGIGGLSVLDGTAPPLSRSFHAARYYLELVDRSCRKWTQWRFDNPDKVPFAGISDNMLKRESRIPFALRKANIVEHLGPVSRPLQMTQQRAADAAALRCVLASIYKGYDSMPPG